MALGRATDLLGEQADDLGRDLAALGPAVEAGQPNQRKALTSATGYTAERGFGTPQAMARHRHPLRQKRPHLPRRRHPTAIVLNHRIRI